MANTNEQTYLPMVGVDMLHYAKITADTASAFSTATPISVPGATEVGFNQNGTVSTFYADNKPYDTATAPGDLDVAVACADVTPAMRADIYGDTYGADGLLSGGELNAPYIAWAYRVMKSNGAYRYVRVFKTKAIPNDQKFQTKGGSINFQTNGFSAKGACRALDGQAFEMLDSDDPKLPSGVTPAIIEQKWFSDFSWRPSTNASK